MAKARAAMSGRGLRAVAFLLLVGAQSPPEAPAGTPPETAGDNCREVPSAEGSPGSFKICEPIRVRISGGKAAPVGLHPWQAQIFSTYVHTKADLAADRRKKRSDPTKDWLELKAAWERQHRCGGVYIGEGFVLTAAHCVTKAPKDYLAARRVRLGTWDLAHPSGDFAIEGVAVHKDYEEATQANDIALIKLALNAPDRALGVRPIRLLGSEDDASRLSAGQTVKVTGWGATRPMRGGGRLIGLDGKIQRASAILKQVDLEVRERERCEAVYTGMTDRMICAGSDVAGDDACTWDSGGPMVWDDGSGPVLAGLVSRGKGCGLKRIPGVYTRVSSYLDWIEAAKAMPLGGVTRM